MVKGDRVTGVGQKMLNGGNFGVLKRERERNAKWGSERVVGACEDEGEGVVEEERKKRFVKVWKDYHKVS